MFPDAEEEKKSDIADVVKTLETLTPIQVEVVSAIIRRFAEEQVSELLREDFLTNEAFGYFSMRLAAHHAYSSSVLKKENFEHILEESFSRTGMPAQRTRSMTARGADLKVGETNLSLKTEAAKGLSANHITISKLMEAAWIKKITSREDIPPYIATMVSPHFENYSRIFILRCFPDTERRRFIRYDLREIPKALLQMVSELSATDFSPLTPTRTTSAEVRVNGRKGFVLRLDGSDDKITIGQLQVAHCPLHAWWSLLAPGSDSK